MILSRSVKVEGLEYVIEKGHYGWRIILPEVPGLDVLTIPFKVARDASDALIFEEAERLLLRYLHSVETIQGHYPEHELSDKECVVLDRCSRLLQRVTNVPPVVVVKFFHPDIGGKVLKTCLDPGCNCGGQGVHKIGISREVLDSFDETLQALVWCRAEQLNPEDPDAEALTLFSGLVLSLAQQEN